MTSNVSSFLSSLLQFIESEPSVAVAAVSVFLLSLHAFGEVIVTCLYCIYMHRCEKETLSVKDCDKLCERPPLRLWSKFKLSKGDDNAENAP